MFSTPAYAQTAAGAAGGSSAFLIQIVPLILLFVIFHILDLTLGQVVASDEFVHGAVRNNLLAIASPVL